jgi:hypothetical protein
MSSSFQAGGEPARSRDTKQKREMQLVFMRRLVHDLNNALSVITIDAGLLRADAAESDPALELLGEVADAAAKAASLSNQLSRCLNEAIESLEQDR